MILLIDNYDSFTYNIYQMLCERGHEVQVVRNDAATVKELIANKPDRLMISPGPGKPDHAGISMEAIHYFAGRIPVLGVCLGHQSLAQCYGGQIVRAERLMHGKTSPVHHHGQGIFEAMPEPFEATRYHSLIVDRASLPEAFQITAWTQQDEIMGLQHGPTGAVGVQFHPESILTEAGGKLLEAFATC